MINLDSILKSRDITLPAKIHLLKAMVFPVFVYGCESWTTKKAEHWSFWSVVLEKTLESPLGCKEIQPVHPEGDQSWVFIGRTDVVSEAPILWPPDVKSWLIGKDPNAGKDWRQEEKGTTEDEMVGWHHWLNGHEFGWTLGAGDGQGGLACCGPWGHKESDMTERLNWTETTTLKFLFPSILGRMIICFWWRNYCLCSDPSTFFAIPGVFQILFFCWSQFFKSHQWENISL